MLDVQRLDAVVCTTALEVELLGALVQARRKLGLAPVKRKRKNLTYPVVYTANDRCGPCKPHNEHMWVPGFRANIVQIQKAVCQRWGVTIGDLRSERRTLDIIVPRQVATMLCRTLTHLSYPMMAKRFGDRDHTTMLHNARKLDWLREELSCVLKVEDSLWDWVDAAYRHYDAAKQREKFAILQEPFSAGL